MPPGLAPFRKTRRMRSAALLALLFALFAATSAGQASAAAVASGRHWRVSIDRVECEARILTLGMKVHYLGPKGPVEAPVHRLVDARERVFAPKALVWQGGTPQLAKWLPSGGLENVQSETVGDIRLRFDVGDAAGELRLEFGDIPAFAVTRRSGRSCDARLNPEEMKVPRAARAGAGGRSKSSVRIYRAQYPCIAVQGAARILQAPHPPYLPRQLLLFGRGYLPNARQIVLPMGAAAAQSYAYIGIDRLDAVEEAAGQAMARDFPQYVQAKHFAFNWGSQAAQSGNEAYAIGVYDLRPCPK
jgi:hypothetical protein